MKPSYVRLSPAGTLEVPDMVTVGVVPGDGAGARWKRLSASVERAVRAAYGEAKHVAFEEYPAGEAALATLNDPCPETTLAALRTARVAFVGGERRAWMDRSVTVVEALRSLLDLYATLVFVPSPEPARGGLALLLDGADLQSGVRELAAGGADELAFVKQLEARHEPIAARLRFGTSAATIAFHAARDEASSGTVLGAVGLRAASPQGAARVVQAARWAASLLGRDRVVFADDLAERPVLGEARRRWRMQALEAAPLSGSVSHQRANVLASRADALAGDLVVIPEAEGMRWLQVVAHRFGGWERAAVARLNLETGHALFGPLLPACEADEAASLEAVRLLLSHLGRTPAAERLSL